MEKNYPEVSSTHTRARSHKSIFCTRFVQEQTDNFDTRQTEFIRGKHIVHHWSSVQFYLNAHYSLELTSGKEFEILPRFRLSTEYEQQIVAVIQWL
jgi:hypothetical protein